MGKEGGNQGTEKRSWLSKVSDQPIKTQKKHHVVPRAERGPSGVRLGDQSSSLQRDKAGLDSQPL